MVTSAPRDSDLRRARQKAIIASVDPRGVLSRPPANYEARAAMSPLDRLSRFKDARVLVVGDVMLDRFVYARVSRLSPEAPVPVLAVEREALSLGGAGNVARNIASLGGYVTLIGGKSRDEAGARLDDLLSGDGRIHNALVTSGHGRTTEKIRYIADRRLTQLGLNVLYHVDKNPLPWLDEMLNAVEHANFFENRSTEYSRASTTGSWEDAFADFVSADLGAHNEI